MGLLALLALKGFATCHTPTTLAKHDVGPPHILLGCHWAKVGPQSCDSSYCSNRAKEVSRIH